MWLPLFLSIFLIWIGSSNVPILPSISRKWNDARRTSEKCFFGTKVDNTIRENKVVSNTWAFSKFQTSALAIQTMLYVAANIPEDGEKSNLLASSLGELTFDSYCRFIAAKMFRKKSGSSLYTLIRFLCQSQFGDILPKTADKEKNLEKMNQWNIQNPHKLQQ